MATDTLLQYLHLGLSLITKVLIPVRVAIVGGNWWRNTYRDDVGHRCRDEINAAPVVPSVISIAVTF